MNQSKMKRPLLFRCLPEKLRGYFYYRFFKPIPNKWLPLFENASLIYASGIEMKLEPTRDYMYESIALLGFYERHLTKLVASLARQGGFMIDVGANVGYFTLIWVANCPTNRCLALEPSLSVLRLLQENVLRNHLNDRVEVIGAAVGNNAGDLFFDPGPDEPTGWGHLVKQESKNCIRVPVVKLDDIVESEETIEFMKVDVEGAELMVFQGCEHLLRKKVIKHIYFERNTPGALSMGFAPNAAWEYLESCGYKVSFLWNGAQKAIADCWAEPAEA